MKFLKKAMRKHGRPEVIVTDLLRSYGAALKEIGAANRQETGRWLNNRAGEFTSAVSMTRTGDASLQAHAKFAEVRLRPRFSLQSL